jgi:hypothetical protein
MFGFSASFPTSNNLWNIELTNAKIKGNAIQFGRGSGWTTINDQINIKLNNVDNYTNAGAPLIVVNDNVTASGAKSYVNIHITGRQTTLGNAIYLKNTSGPVPNVYFDISGRIVLATGYAGIRVNSTAAITSNIILNNLTVVSSDGVTAGMQGAVANTYLTNYLSRTNVAPTNITSIVNPILVDANVK